MQFKFNCNDLYLDSSFDETSLNAAGSESFTIASDFNPSTSASSLDTLDPFYTDSSDDLILHQPESDLLLSSNAACSFDSSFLDETSGDTGVDLELFGKRDVHQACKTSQQGSKKSGSNPEDFLNNLPIFRAPLLSDFTQDKHTCNPYVVGDRPVPVCLFGEPFAMFEGDWHEPGVFDWLFSLYVLFMLLLMAAFISKKLTAFSIQMILILFRVAHHPPYLCVVMMLIWTMTW